MRIGSRVTIIIALLLACVVSVTTSDSVKRRVVRKVIRRKTNARKRNVLARMMHRTDESIAPEGSERTSTRIPFTQSSKVPGGSTKEPRGQSTREPRGGDSTKAPKGDGSTKTPKGGTATAVNVTSGAFIRSTAIYTLIGGSGIFAYCLF